MLKRFYRLLPVELAEPLRVAMTVAGIAHTPLLPTTSVSKRKKPRDLSRGSSLAYWLSED
jgi:hypothetical protein